MKTRSRLIQQRLDTAVLTDARDFATLEEEWAELYEDCPSVTPFQSWAWLYSWWEHYGDGYELRLVTVREGGGLLVGVLPLMLERRWGVGRLLFVGNGLSDYLDVIVGAGREDNVLESGVQTLKRMEHWHIADLQHLRPEAAAWGLQQWWDGPQISLWQDSCPVVEVKPWDELLASLSRNLRSTIRRALRRAASDGLERKVANASNIRQAAERLVALHREAWQDRPIGPEHSTQRFEAFTVAATERLAYRELASVSEFWQDGEVHISALLMFGRDFCGTYILGASQKALQRYQWSSLYIWDAVEIALGRGSDYLDLLRGEEPYKLRWSSGTISTRRLILGRQRTAWIPYAGYHALRSRAKAYTHSERAPRWIRDPRELRRVLMRYRAFRSEVPWRTRSMATRLKEIRTKGHKP